MKPLTTLAGSELAGCVFSASAAAVVRIWPVDAATRPSFVFFLTDDQPYLSMSCAGNTVLKSTARDQQDREGVRFEKAFVVKLRRACPFPSLAVHLAS